MGNYKVEVLPVEKTLLGEGPHWDAERQELFYVDIIGKSVYRYNPSSGEHSKVTIKDENCLGKAGVGLVIPVAGTSNAFVIAHGRSLKRLEWDLKSETPTKLTPIYDAEDDLEGAFNDGKCDANGQLWAGTMPANPSPDDPAKCVLYTLQGKATAAKRLEKVGLSNGLAWSADNKTFYFIDSFAGGVDGFDHDLVTGEISNRRQVFDFKAHSGLGLADGMTIDEEGNLWVACFSSSRVICVDPRTGKLLSQIDFPTSNITSVAFGGKDLDTLYVTSAKNFLSEEQQKNQPHAGSVFKVTNLGVKGLTAGIAYKEITSHKSN